MQLTFLGANGQVTGSRYCLESGGTRVMVDCGLVQEREFLERNWQPCPLAAGSIRTLLLTHIHIDHSGLIPRFVRDGFKGKILATRPTADLADVVLRDSAKIQEEDAAYKAKRHRREGRRGKYPEQPLYTTADVERTLPQFRGVDYDEPFHLADGMTVTFRDAGHILGSAMLELHVGERENRRTIIFSGDIGQRGKPLIGDPTTFDHADYIIMESTYGGRAHAESGDIETRLAEVINATVSRGGNVVVPTFAIERAQELMFYIGRLVYTKRIPEIPVFLDSPMAVDVTQIFHQHQEFLDDESRQLINSNQPPLHYPGLRLVQSHDASVAINHQKGPCIVMSPAGMCNAGRIKHHLRNNIGRQECTILFVGYQAGGTLGRQILDGSPEVRIHGRMHSVKATIAHIDGLSGHADQSGLLEWLSALQSPPRRIFLTHGEQSASQKMLEEIQKRWNWEVAIPAYGDVVTLT